MAGTSENGVSNALNMGPSSRYTLNLYLTIFIIFVISFYDALDHCVRMAYKHPVILVIYYIFVMLAAIIHNLNMPCSHVLNHARMIYLIIYDYIIAMINYLYVIMFIRILFWIKLIWKLLKCLTQVSLNVSCNPYPRQTYS